MFKLFATAMFGLILTSTLNAQAGTELKGLTRLNIVIENLGDVEAKAHLDAESLEATTLVALKRDLPKVSYDKDAVGYVYVNVLCMEVGNPGSHAVACNVGLAINRLVSIVPDPYKNGSDGIVHARVYNTGIMLTGDLAAIGERVRQKVSDLMTRFAAEYYRQNP